MSIEEYRRIIKEKAQKDLETSLIIAELERDKELGLLSPAELHQYQLLLKKYTQGGDK